ncbi:MAG: flippase-like domain-containing protein, partial [Clostridiales bacterium]|nr:flippase-like domain-containing protein [Clostridiales bacterium]
SLMKGNYKAIFVFICMTAVQFLAFFSITYFIYRAFGLNTVQWVEIIFVQAFLYMAVSFVPTPGSTGASETGFIFFFKLFFPKNLIFVSMVLWRLLSYHINIVTGAIVILADSIRSLVKPAAHDV